MTVGGRRTSRCARGTMLLVLAVIAPAAPAVAATPGPHWTVISQPAPTYFHPGDHGDFYEVIAVNDGGGATSGEITVTDTLPGGLVATAVNAIVEQKGESKGEGTPMTCPSPPVTGAVTCKTLASVPTGKLVLLKVNLEVPVGASGTLTNSATISGGGAPPADATNATPVTPTPDAAPYGASLVTHVVNAGGVTDTQAGSHPFDFTTLVAFNVGSVDSVGPSAECELGSLLTPSCAQPEAETKDVEVELPAGLVGNPTVLPRCSQPAFHTNSFRGCPANTQVGAMYLVFYGKTHLQYAPVYNVEPPQGQPAELGFSVSLFAHLPMYFHVRSDGDYGLTADVSDISEQDPVRAIVLSIWGVPADESHDEMRESQENCDPTLGCPSGVVPKPFLTLPTSCTGAPLAVPFASDSWQSPEAQPATLFRAALEGMSGCETLSFSPSLSVAPTTDQATAPAGYDVHVDVPQSEEVEGLATPDVRDAEVTMPAGTVISPSAANGLLACSEGRFQLKSRAAGECPTASKIGNVKVTTPLLDQPLTGSVYVGKPECAPCSSADAEAGRMVRLLIEAKGSGVIIKLAGRTTINQATGQLTTRFTENPQLPFSDLELSLEGGQDAPLVNPGVCGPAIATARLTPWSMLTAAEVSAPAVPISGCSAPGFTPALRAGTTGTAQASAFSPFAVTLTRPDGQQDLGSVTVDTPPGLLGMLSHVTLCEEAAANAGTCPVSSQIGTTSATVGPGAQPYEVGGGKVFLTGPYHGKPFGLSIVLPATAGPFTLAGNSGRGTEVVRASIAVDPTTTALTVTSDELPQVLNGIPLHISRVVVNINREGFMFNPTNCNPMAVRGAVTSTTRTVAAVSFPFQAVNCATLAFKPRFTVLTHAKTSKADGAYLHVKVTSGPGQANIGKVKVDLPKQLPSRLTTLQQACPDATFNANPALCPAGSLVGTATAVTPILKNALTGPAYLVSHAAAAFPDLVIVLQGEGITLDLVGNTDIKKGITISTFNAVPDAPISTFDLVLPEGPHSALAAYGNLCKTSLNMPTALTGQNGAEIRQTTRIAVSGCPKHKHAKKARRAKTHRKGRSGRR
jgi:hypothetical protein